MKKIHILILMFLLFIPVFVNAESIQTGKFKYMPAFEDETEEVYYYSDNYFKESGKIDNEHLLAMSYNMALSTFEIRGCSYSKTLLEEIRKNNVSAEQKNEPCIVGVCYLSKNVENNEGAGVYYNDTDTSETINKSTFEKKNFSSNVQTILDQLSNSSSNTVNVANSSAWKDDSKGIILVGIL